MFKLISHALMLAVGASLGIWWGVHHPVPAYHLVQEEDAKIAQAKVEILQRIRGNPTTQNIDQNLTVENQHLQQAQQN